MPPAPGPAPALTPGHRLVMAFVGRQIAVSCTCQLDPPFSRPGKGRPCQPFEIRPKWTAAEVQECFRSARHLL